MKGAWATPLHHITLASDGPSRGDPYSLPCPSVWLPDSVGFEPTALLRSVTSAVELDGPFCAPVHRCLKPLSHENDNTRIIPMEGWYRNPLRMLKDPSMKVEVIWRNGQHARQPYEARQLRWIPWPTGPSSHDIEWFRPCGG